MLVTNRYNYSSIESDLVYPLNKGYKLIVKLDPSFVKDELMRIYGKHKINNKYVIDVLGKLWYQHDNDTWLIEERNEDKGLK